MPINTRAYSSVATHQSATRHRVDRQDELCEDVPQERRWVTVELARRDCVELVVGCDQERVRVEPGEGLPDGAPDWVGRVLEYLSLDDVYVEEE